jgi:hypothetical protein
MSIFIVITHEIVTFFDINIIPFFDSIKNIVSNIKIRNDVKLKDITISSIRELSKETFFNNTDNKLYISGHDKPDKTLSDGVLDNNLNRGLEKRSHNSSSNKYNDNSDTHTSTRSTTHSRNTSRRSRHAIRNTGSRLDTNDNITRINDTNNSNNTNNNNPVEYTEHDYVERNHNRRTNDVLFDMNDIYVLPYRTSSNNSIPVMPITPNPYSNLTTPSTMTPLFGSSQGSFNTVNNTVNNDPVFNTSQNLSNLPINHNITDSSHRDSYCLPNATYMPEANNINYTERVLPTHQESITDNNRFVSSNNDNRPTSYESYTSLPTAQEIATAYLPNKTDINQVHNNTGVLNIRPHPSYVTTNNINWNEIRGNIQRNMIEEYRGYSSKEVVVPAKKGILSNLKVGFKYLDEKMHKVDSVYVTFRDKSKRKFIWTLWENNSGNYESYKDFKDSWNPKTSIWKEIKDRTRRDMRADIEGIVGISRNTKTLGNTTREVKNLQSNPLRNNRINYKNSNIVNNNINSDNNAKVHNDTEPETRRRHKRKHGNTSSNDSDANKHRHKRSNGHKHSHNRHRHDRSRNATK